MNFPHSLLVALLAGAGPGVSAQAQTGSSPSARVQAVGSQRPDQEGQGLVRDFLAQMPDRSITMRGLLKLRDADGKRSEVPIQYTVVPEAGGWRGTYETRASAGRGGERLVIVHRQNEPTRYLHATAGASGALKEPVTLMGEQAAIPFAGSDYWLSDLGLEFLHWSDQRLARDAKITMRQSRPCKVIDSFSPSPARTKYARVRSWLDAENGAPIYAEGFDEKGRRLKIFSLHGFTKVSGRWQPKDLEMLNEQTDSRTRLELSLESE